MPGQAIIIIGSSGGGTRATLQAGVPVPIGAGESVKNMDATGEAHVIFSVSGVPAENWYIKAGQSETAPTAGVVELQP